MINILFIAIAANCINASSITYNHVYSIMESSNPEEKLALIQECLEKPVENIPSDVQEYLIKKHLTSYGYDAGPGINKETNAKVRNAMLPLVDSFNQDNYLEALVNVRYPTKYLARTYKGKLIPFLLRNQIDISDENCANYASAIKEIFVIANEGNISIARKDIIQLEKRLLEWDFELNAQQCWCKRISLVTIPEALDEIEGVEYKSAISRTLMRCMECANSRELQLSVINHLIIVNMRKEVVQNLLKYLIDHEQNVEVRYYWKELLEQYENNGNMLNPDQELNDKYFNDLVSI